MHEKVTVYSEYREQASVQLQPGDIIIFKSNMHNSISRAFNWGLHLLEKNWDRWGWHTGYISEIMPDGSIITAESLQHEGVRTVIYPCLEALGEVRVYRWLDTLDVSALRDFTLEHVGSPYDVACYLWTSIQRLFVAISHRLLPRKIDDRYTCWELVCAMARSMQKPLQPIEQYPIITDMERALESTRIL